MATAELTPEESKALDAYDPLSPEAMGNSYPALSLMLRKCPVHHHAPSDLYTVTRWDSVSHILSDPDTYISGRGVGPYEAPAMQVLVQADDPDHRRHRQVLSHFYGPKRTADMAPEVERICHELIDRFAHRGECDFVNEFAYPFSIRVLAAMLGWEVSDDDVENLKNWQMDILAMLAGDQSKQEKGFASFLAMVGYAFVNVQDRRTRIAAGHDVPDDPTSALARSELSDEEIVSILPQIFNHDTVAAMFLHGMYLLLTHPAQYAKLAGDPGLTEAAVEEILRFRPPILGTCRITTEDTTVDGTAIAEGSRIRLVYGAANHDPAHWEDPDEFRIDRDLAVVRRHVSFGTGRHLCLGAAISRLEGQIGLRALIERLPNLRLDPQQPPVLEDAFWFVHTFRVMRLRWDPSARGAG
jgi:cytochrome P450